jgi:predicted nucleic acid-binding protein
VATLLDTTILARLANTKDATFPIAQRAVMELHRGGETLHITSQNLIEFRNVATRSTKLNGLGLSIPETESKAGVFEATFPLLLETPDILPAWKSIASALKVVGKQVHDARLVAVCHVHGVRSILTFNIAHFHRFASFGSGLTVLDPASI